jgi:diguanylate cyclase (GGDEF)-like protein
VTPPITTPVLAADLSLERAEALCRRLADDIPATAIVLFDQDLRVRVAAGPSWAEIGLRVEDLTGLRPEEYLEPAVHRQIVPHFEAALAGAVRSWDTAVGERTFRSKAAPVTADDGSPSGVLCVSWDDSSLRRAEQNAAELERRLAQQSAVARLGELALRRPDLGLLLDAACRAVSETLGVELVSFWEPTDRDGWMHVRAGVGWPDGYVGSEHEVAHFAVAEGRAPYAHGPVVIDDLPTDTTWRARALRAHGVVSIATVLVGRSDDPAGLLGAFSRERRTFTPHDLDFLRAVGHVLNGAIEGLRVDERIRHDALHDALTGLPNRTLLLERLSHALAGTERDGRRLALFFLDVDNLKVLNDSLGHHAGDELLRAIGPRLRSILRPADTVARFGGDEFAVLCEDVTGDAVAQRLAERLVRAFDEPFEVGGEPRFGSVSVGVVVSDPASPRSPYELLSHADAALYRAKERGRGRHEVFDAGLRARITSRLRVEDELRRALDGEGELWVAYQPFFRLPGGGIAGVEALLRWEHPQRGPVEPAEFIPVAEDSGLIVEIGERVLRSALAQVARWHASGLGADLKLTVNVSARQVALPGLVETVRSALAETGIRPDAVGLEITEGLLLEETPTTAETLAALQELGVRLVLDDFGTGYSSLGYLRRYAPDIIKIDGSFVNDLGPAGDGDAAIVEAIVGMAKALGLRVIPEGVETAGQLARLAAIGCDYAQGFHLSRPMTAEGLEALLRKGRS